jgi:hypothetical protein
MAEPTAQGLSLGSIVHAQGELLATDLSETEMVMLDIEKGRYFGVEAVANTIWKSIKDPKTVEDVCAVVAATYDAPREEVEMDALEFLGRLVEAGLARVDDGQS